VEREFFIDNPLVPGKVDVRLPGKGNSNSHGARPVHLIITMTHVQSVAESLVDGIISIFDRTPEYCTAQSVTVAICRVTVVIFVDSGLR